MQGKFARDSALVGACCVSRLAILAGIPFLAAFVLSAPALAACGASHPAGVHSGAGTGAHAPSSSVKSGATGGGSGTLGCANGASAPVLHGLAMAGSGKVIEGGAHPAAHTATHVRTAAKKTANATRPRDVKPPHHP